MKRVVEGVVFGWVVGLPFPLLATFMLALENEVSWSAYPILTLHRTVALLQMIDAIPLLLGMAFGIVGFGLAKQDELIERLKGRVEQRTATLASARQQATSALQKRGDFQAQALADLAQAQARALQALKGLRALRLMRAQLGVVSEVEEASAEVLSQIEQLRELAELDGDDASEMIRCELGPSVQRVFAAATTEDAARGVHVHDAARLERLLHIIRDHAQDRGDDVTRIDVRLLSGSGAEASRGLVEFALTGRSQGGENVRAWFGRPGRLRYELARRLCQSLGGDLGAKRGPQGLVVWLAVANAAQAPTLRKPA